MTHQKGSNGQPCRLLTGIECNKVIERIVHNSNIQNCILKIKYIKGIIGVIFILYIVHVHNVDRTYWQTPSTRNHRLPAVSENYRLTGVF